MWFLLFAMMSLPLFFLSVLHEYVSVFVCKWEKERERDKWMCVLEDWYNPSIHFFLLFPLKSLH